MERSPSGGLGVRHLSEIKEESDSREHSFLPPPLVQRYHQQQLPVHTDGGGAGLEELETEEEKPQSDAVSLQEHQGAVEDNGSLLDELGRIEAELRLDEERQQETQFLQQQENMLLWQNLCYLSLNQRVAKPWVSSYFRKFPMHIYCLPVQAPGDQRRRRKRK